MDGKENRTLPMDLESMKRKNLKLARSEELCKRWLERVRDQKHKIEVEYLQLKGMLDSAIYKQIYSEFKSLPKKVRLVPANSDEEINQQELELNVTDALTSMVEGSFYTDCNEEKDDDEEGTSLNEDYLEAEVASSIGSRKRNNCDAFFNKANKVLCPMKLK